MAPKPWRTMWLAPRLTIRRVIDADVRPSWVPVVALAALNVMFMSMQLDPGGGTISVSRSFMPVAVSVLQVVFGVLIGPFVLAIVGGWFDGGGDPAELRHAVAWSYLPVAAATPSWIPPVFAYGSPAFLPLAFLAAVVVVFASLWSTSLLVAGIAEVHRFSIFRGIVTIMILLVPTVLLGALGA